MKKILFLLLICVIKLSAYNLMFHEIYRNGDIDRQDFYSNESNANRLYIKYVYPDGRIGNNKVNDNEKFILNTLYRIKTNYTSINEYYISNNDFINFYKNNPLFLNDFYIQAPNIFLNYLYNNNYFSQSEYIEFDNYELLYNSDGLAVESIVNGEWAGLYDNKEESGFLFNSNGQLIYKNGVELKGINLLLNLFIVKILNAFNDIDWNSIKLIPFIVLALSLFFFLLSKFKGVFSGRFKSFN